MVEEDITTTTLTKIIIPDTSVKALVNKILTFKHKVISLEIRKNTRSFTTLRIDINRKMDFLKISIKKELIMDTTIRIQTSVTNPTKNNALIKILSPTRTKIKAIARFQS